MAIVTTRLKTTGLHCPSCSMLIQMDVEDMEGVVSVHADHHSGLAEVEHDPELVRSDEIVAAIVKLGYGAEVESG
ncbi:MAG: cation transporter [Coriobacteriia bacterium]|nr:cation transporter [Coriobacteriia bacterium]